VYKYDDVRVIQNDDLVAKRLQSLNSKLVGVQTETIDESLFVSGLEKIIVSEPEYKGPSKAELMEKAKQEILEMKETAQTEIDVLKQEAISEGKAQGLIEGNEQAAKQLKLDLARNEVLLQQKQEELRMYYEQKIEEIEPMLIDTLSDIYQHIFQVDIKSRKELIVYLLGNMLKEIEGSREFLVHLSREDYPVVTARREELKALLMPNSSLEFIEDALVSQSNCYIEAEGGIYDCGLTTQLEELKTQLKLLSYSK